MDTIATLSDWSEYVAGSGGESSYVTAYPLKESGYYVIAKTWYADEMKRPGCVWTHSLLLPFDLLNSIDDFKRFSSLFERPSEESGFDFYARQIDYENKPYTSADYQQLEVDRGIATLVMAAFLNAKNWSLTFGGISNNHSYEQLMLGAMTAVPMKMLQNVSWTTGTAYSRKLEGNPLTCQILSNPTDVKQKAKVGETEPWISYVTDALMRGDVNQGQLIRMFADDIGDRVEYYAAVVRVLYTLEDYFKTGKNGEERYNTVFDIIAKEFPEKNSGMVLKKLCASKSFSLRYCSETTFFFLFATLDLDGVFDVIDTGIEERWHSFVQDNHDQYVSLLSTICESGNLNRWGLDVLGSSVCILNDDDVVKILKTDYHLFSTITQLNPRLLDEVQWSILTQQEIESVMPMLLDVRTQKGFTKWSLLFMVLLEKGVEIDGRLASLLFGKTDKATGILLDYVNKDASRYVNYTLVKQLEHQTLNVLSWLGAVDTITEGVAYAIVSAVDEKSDTVTKAGATVWTPFHCLEFHNLRSDVYAFLFSLSFNWPFNKDAIELMRMSFYPLHTLQASKSLGYGNWSRIAGYMEAVMPWDEWDYCKKMRKTVVKRLKRAGYDKSVLDGFTPNESLNEMLRKMW